MVRACVNVTFIIEYRDGDTLVIKDSPIFLDEGEDTKLLSLWEMRKLQLRLYFLPVNGLVVGSIKDRIDRV